MVMYRFPKHHKTKQQIQKPKQQPTEQELVIKEKPIEIKIINGKKIEIYKYRL